MLDVLTRYGAGSGLDAEHAVYGLVDVSLLPVLVEVEAASVLPAATIVGRQSFEGRGSLHPASEGRFEDLADLGANVDPDLVAQRDGSDREPPRHHGLVDFLDGGAVFEQIEHFGRVGADDAGRVEPGAIVHDDDGLALTLAKGDHGGGDPVGRFRSHDDLQQGHLLDRREVVHAHDVGGPRRTAAQSR